MAGGQKNSSNASGIMEDSNKNCYKIVPLESLFFLSYVSYVYPLAPLISSFVALVVAIVDRAFFSLVFWFIFISSAL